MSKDAQVEARLYASKFMRHTLDTFQIARDYLADVPVEERDPLCRAALKAIKKEYWEQYPNETWSAYVRLMETITYNLPGAERRVGRKPRRKRK